MTNSCGGKPSSFLTRLELRLLEFLATQTAHDFIEEVVLYCRICLTSTYDLSYIFQKTNDNVNLVDKINHCASIPEILKDDAYPQNICRACVTLAENAFKFKVLCEQSDTKLRSMTKEELMKGEFEKTETVEVIKLTAIDDDDDDESEHVENSFEDDGEFELDQMEVEESKHDTNYQEYVIF